MKVTRSALPGVHEMECGCVLIASTDRIEYLDRECYEYRELLGEMPHGLLWYGHLWRNLPEDCRRITFEHEDGDEDEDDGGPLADEGG